MNDEQFKEAVDFVRPLANAKTHEALAVWLAGMEGRREVFDVAKLLHQMKTNRVYHKAVRLCADHGHTLPPRIASYLKRNPRPGRKGKMPHFNRWRAVCMVVERYGVKPMKNPLTGTRSACCVVAKAFGANYDAIEFSYLDYERQKKARKF